MGPGTPKQNKETLKTAKEQKRSQKHQGIWDPIKRKNLEFGNDIMVFGVHQHDATCSSYADVRL